MASALPRVANLLAVAEELQQAGKVRKLVKAVRAAAKVSSCLADLKQAADMLATLGEPFKGTLDEKGVDRGGIERALLSTAISLYVRGVHTDSKSRERGASRVEQAFEGQPEIAAAHKRLISTRNEALAHVLLGEAIEDVVWHEVAIVAVEHRPFMWQAAAFSNQIGLHRRAIADLAMTLPIARGFLKAKINGAFDNISKIISEQVPAAELNALMEKHSFDTVQFMGSYREAAAALRDRDPGSEASGLIIR